MKSFKMFIALGFALSAFVAADAAKLNVKIVNTVDNAKVTLTLETVNDKKECALGADGTASFDLTGYKSQYATVKYARRQAKLYIDAKKDMSITLDGKDYKIKTTFEGSMSAVNSYLNYNKLVFLNYSDVQKTESACIKTADSLYIANLKYMESLNLPSNFKQQEKIRLKYVTYSMLPMYPLYNKSTSSAFYDKIKSLTEIKASLLDFSDYRSYLSNAIASMSLRGAAEDVERTTLFLDYTQKEVKDAKVKEYLVNSYVTQYIKNSGVDKADPYAEIFHKYVKNPKMIEAFNELWAKWEKLKAGNVAPVFYGTDINGKRISSTDLKGKYVYVDVWATWCGPCRGELPHMKKMEEKYEGSDIHFVSLSCDQDKSAWEKVINKGDMKGIQLHLEKGNTMMDAYMINGIPRFILLDREGKIISADMTRPSNPKTSEKIDELLKK